MVATRSQKVSSEDRDKKTRRFSLLDHALGALVDLQVRNGSKKHSIRAFRNQVIKNTEAQNDPLRKGWKRWIDLACEKLMNLGILDNQAPPGQVVLTSEGKKKLNEASKALELQPEHTHAPDCSEPTRIRNYLCETQSISRKEWERRASGKPQFQIDLEYLLQHGGNEKKLMRLKKAELVAGINKLSTYLTKIVELEEANRKLKSELEDKDDTHLDLLDEVMQLKEELSSLSQVTNTSVIDEYIVLEEDDMLIDPPSFMDVDMDYTSEYTLDTVTPNSPSVYAETDVCEIEESTGTDIEQHQSGIMKTITNVTSLFKSGSLRATGSIISQISKCPTPAPSDIGSVPGTPLPSGFEMNQGNILEPNQSTALGITRAPCTENVDYSFINEPSFDPDVTYVNDDPVLPSTPTKLGKGKARIEDIQFNQLMSPPQTSPLRFPSQLQSCMANGIQVNNMQVFSNTAESIHVEKYLANKAVVCQHEEEIKLLKESLSQKDVMIKELKEEYAKKLQEMEAKLKIAEDNMMEAYENLKQYLEGDIIKQEEEERRRREQEAARAKERAAHMEKLNIVKSKMQQRLVDNDQSSVP